MPLRRANASLRGMVEIADIKDEKRLEAWLDALPRDKAERRRIAVSLAHRVAMRVLPVWWKWSQTEAARNRGLTALLILRCALISGVASEMPTPELRAAASAAGAANVATPDHTIIGAATPASHAAAHAAAAARAAASTAAAFSTDADVAVIMATFSAARAVAEAVATASTASIWNNIRTDCAALAKGDHLDTQPLWAGDNPLEREWRDVRDALPEGSDFWRRWYQDALDGHAPNWPLLEQIALIDAEIWDAGPDRVNARIARIEQKSANHDPTDIDSALRALSAPAPTTVTAVREIMQRNRAELPPTYDAIEALILLEIERLQQKNYRDDGELAEAKRQIGVFLTLHSAIVRMRDLIPASGDVTDAEAKETLGLWQLYKSKFAELPRAKADEVGEGAWETGKATVQFGLIAGSAYLATLIGVAPQIGLPVAAMCFAPKKAGEIIKTAKEAFWRKSD